MESSWHKCSRPEARNPNLTAVRILPNRLNFQNVNNPHVPKCARKMSRMSMFHAPIYGDSRNFIEKSPARSSGFDFGVWLPECAEIAV
jgi:hypothetical protein